MTLATPFFGDNSAVESLLAFWADAGIDVCLEDAPVNRLQEASQRQRAQPAVAAVASLAAVPNMSATAAQRKISEDAAALDQARGLARSALDLEALAAAIAGFSASALRRGPDHQPVLWRGNTDASILIIAEAPLAEDESAAGRLSGREGQLLERMLDAAGLKDRSLVSHTVYWHPAGGRVPSVAEQTICRPFVERLIELVQPKHILLLGAASARAVLDLEDGILALRGRWFDWRSQDGALSIPTLITMTPGFLLQQPAAKKKAWADLLAFCEKALAS